MNAPNHAISGSRLVARALMASVERPVVAGSTRLTDSSFRNSLWTATDPYEAFTGIKNPAKLAGSQEEYFSGINDSSLFHAPAAPTALDASLLFILKGVFLSYIYAYYPPRNGGRHKIITT